MFFRKPTFSFLLLTCCGFAFQATAQNDSSTIKQLKGVEIKSNKPLIKQAPDRLVYDVQSDPAHLTESVTEMLTKVPLVTVDGDNNIRVKGRGDFRVFIDGKPSAVTAANPRDVLRVMPALKVARIEIITIPPAKYDAEGFGSIINIVTVKQRNDGYSLAAGAGYNLVNGFNENLSLTTRFSKWQFKASAYLYQDIARTNTAGMHQQTAALQLQQDGSTSYRSTFGTAVLEALYEADSLNHFAASVTAYRSKDHYKYQQQNSTNIPENDYEYINNNTLSGNSVDYTFSYDKGFRRHKSQLLSIGYRLHTAPQQVINDMLITGKNRQALFQENNNRLYEHTMQADLLLPLRALELETGVKAILRNGAADYRSSDIAGLTPSFGFGQHVYGAYLSVRNNTGWLQFSGGLRTEYSDIRIDNTGSRHYLNWIPGISLQHTFANGNSIKAGYTQRITRPAVNQLSPFTDKANPQVVTTGNALLRPSIQHETELTFSGGRQFSYYITGSYTSTVNGIEQVLSLTDSNTVLTYRNIGKQRIAHINAGCNYSLGKRWRFTISTDDGYTDVRSGAGPDAYANHGFTASGFINVNFLAGNSWRISASSYTATGTISLQGTTNAYTILVTRISREIFKKNGTISFSLSNPWQQYRYIRTSLETPALSQTTVQQRNYRSIGISFSYRLSRLHEAISNNRVEIRNDDIKSSSKKND